MEKLNDVVVRFAPSPTGSLHCGGVRTALYNYLFAKQHGGKMLLRLEDTDQTRFVDGAEKYIIDSLAWCGITFDAGVNDPHYKQSERMKAGIYSDYILPLIASGNAYYAFDTKESLATSKLPYDHKTRLARMNSLTMSEDDVNKLLASGADYVVRLKVQPGKTIVVSDMILGNVSFDSGNLDDKVLLKTGGMPSYHFANVVDDHLMKVSHVIRGNEWMNSAPFHVLLYNLLGWDVPVFAHLPLLMKPVGQGKLSKRDGATFGIPVVPLSWNNGEYIGFKEAGYLPEPLMNFLAILSWSPGNNEEIMTMDRMIEAFDLSKVSKSGSRFLIDKLTNFNGVAIRAMNLDKLVGLVKPFVPVGVTDDYLTLVVASLKERINTLDEFYTKALYYFHDDFEYDPAMVKRWVPEAKDVLVALNDIYSSPSLWDGDATDIALRLHQEYDSLMVKLDLKGGKIMPAMRLIMTGCTFGPPVFDIAAIIGRDRTLDRISRALATFG